MKKAERIFIIFNLIFSFVILYESRLLPANAEFGVGPGFLPKVVSILSIILCFILIAKSFFKKSSFSDDSKFATKEGFFRLISTFFLLVVSVIAMHYIGMIIPLVLFLVIVFCFIEKYKVFASIRVAVLSVLIFYLIFKVWLGVPIQII